MRTPEQLRTYRKRAEAKPNRVYMRTLRGAKLRGKTFKLTYKQFMTFWKEPCHYCGDEIKTIGLDRVDTSKGYTYDNVVPCCGWCNYMKHTHSVKEFINKCRIIAERNL